MMRHQLGIGILLMAAFGPPAAMADLTDLTTYTINFTGTGTLPTAGSFTYDPDTATFTAFTVTWDTFTFDLTSSANAPTAFPAYPVCIGSGTGGAAAFALLSGQCNPPSSPNGVTDWSARYVFPSNGGISFQSVTSEFLGGGCPCTEFQVVEFQLLQGGPNPVFGHGSWTLTASPASVPEPSTLILLLTALVSVAFGARKRIARGCRQTTGTVG
jgi:hypothetical protein